LNLAGVYLELGKKVLLVDFDFRKPKVHRGFDLPNENGFSEFLLGQLTKKDIIVHTKTGIDIIRRGQRIPRPNVALESKLLRDLITSLREDYDVIIIDSPPVLVATDAVLISKFADATIFLVAEGRTHKDAVIESVNILRDNGANVVGVFANFTKHHNGTYGYGGKYAYYEESDDDVAQSKPLTNKRK
jgi:capsular exopolysaccharide synthesis family protein